MPTALEVTKKQLYSDAHSRYESESIAIEDCRFLNFTELLDDADIFKNPTPIRHSGLYGKGKWSVLGYSSKGERQIVDEDEDEDEENTKRNFEIKWSHVVFNGFFTDDIKEEKATKKQIETCVKETVRFLEKTFSNELINDVSETREFQKELIKQNSEDNIERLDICIVTDRVIEQENLETKVILKNYDVECRIQYWDLKRWNQLKRSKSKREPIDIDFSSENYNMYQEKVSFIERDIESETNNNIKQYLAMFPADLIYELYDTHHTRLLENNVRVFLSATRKANKGIRDTIKNDPNKFFSFNNGISATAESIMISGEKILLIKDFQIVNGGQTTATIHYSRKKDKSKLDNVFVAVKITALKKDEEYSKIVGDISKAANTQSTIASSDFYANRKMLVDIEYFSNKNPVENNLNRNVFYFFERMKGQYNVAKNNEGTESQKRKWEKGNPKQLMFNKIDLARWSNIMEGLPHVAAAGAEKQFVDFMENKHFTRPNVNLSYFKNLIGCGLVFKRVKKLCGTSNGKIYPSLIKDLNTGEHVPVAMSTAIYTASYLHLITKGKLDYWAFFNYKYGLAESLIITKEKFASDLDNLFIDLIKACWKQIAKFGGAAAQERTKSVSCWDYVKENISLPVGWFNKLEKFMISDNELENRNSSSNIDENYKYFDSLNILLQDGGRIISNIYSLCMTQSKYAREKSTLGNLINKIKQKDKLLSFKRISETQQVYIDMLEDGLELTNSTDLILTPSINVKNIYQKIFKDVEKFKKDLYEYVMESDDNFQKYEGDHDQILDIIESYHIEYGTTIKNLNFLDAFLNKMSS